MLVQILLIVELEDIFFFEIDFELPQQGEVLISKRSASVMVFLIDDVTNNSVQLRMAVRERPVSLLPGKFAASQFLSIDPFR